MATAQERNEIANELWAARRERAVIAPPSERLALFDLDDGYAVGDELSAKRVAAGERRAGLKVGFTNTAVWTTLGLGEPICALVYDRSLQHVDRAAEKLDVDIAPFVAPAIEPEIVLGIGPDGVAWWALGFEIVQCHYPDWKMKPADALADGGLHAALIVGGKVNIWDGSNALQAPFGIELLRNGVVYETATTAAVLGGPLHVLQRASDICERLPNMPPPAPGEVVTTGSLTSAPRIAPGDVWTVRAENAAPELEIVVSA